MGTQHNQGKTESGTSFLTGRQQPEDRKHLPLPPQETQKQLPISLLSKPLETYSHPAASQPPAPHSMWGAAFWSHQSYKGLYCFRNRCSRCLGTTVLATASCAKRGWVWTQCVFLSQKKKKKKKNPFESPHQIHTLILTYEWKGVCVH